jgi:hypothetical protein
MFTRYFRTAIIRHIYSLIGKKKQIRELNSISYSFIETEIYIFSSVSCVNFFLFCSFSEIFFMKTEIMNIHFFFIKSQVYFVQMKCTYVYFEMNFHATFLKQFLIKHILSCFSGIREALQNICVMHYSMNM